MHGFELFGRKLRVEFANPRRSGGDRDRGDRGDRDRDRDRSGRRDR